MDPAREVLISAESHVLEPRDLWATRLPARLRDHAPVLPERSAEDHPDATDPSDRLAVMQRDTVSGEVLFPTYALDLYALEDAALQEACFSVYNDWLVEYCAATPGRLLGLPAISTYTIEHAVRELERTAGLGLRGALLWYVPHPDLQYTTDHYERFWAAAQSMDMPVTLHVGSGFSSTARPAARAGVEQYRRRVGSQLGEAINVLFDFILYGVLERFPRLKLVIAGAEIGWLPWLFQAWDQEARRLGRRNTLPGSLLPSDYFQRQMSVTFSDDAVGARSFSWGWGLDNAMWSSDFGHANSTWPHSRDVVARDVAHLPDHARARLLRENVARLYRSPMPSPI